MIAALEAARPDREPDPGTVTGTEASAAVTSAWRPRPRRSASPPRSCARSWRDGQTIAEVAEAEGVDIEAVKDAMLEAFRTREQERVTSGRLTQAQADANIAAFEDRLDDLVSNDLHRTVGRRRRRCEASPTTEAPTTEAPTTTG